MNMEQALQTFLVESRELIQGIEDALIRLEHDPEDRDAVDAMFRAAHTLKGSAGLFGLDDIVSFTHVVESLMERIRDGETDLGKGLAAILLSCCDHLGALVDHTESQPEQPLPDDLRQHGGHLLGQLSAYGQTHAGMAPTAVATAQAGSAVPVEGMDAESDHWHLSLRFGREVLRNGMDPLSFIRYLGSIGQIVRVVTVADAVPEPAELDPECCYLGFEIAFKCDADKRTIESVFEFVREDAEIRILPPHSKISEYVDLIHDLPEGDMYLGEILIKVGTLTRHELDTALKVQAADQEGKKPIGEILVESGVVAKPVLDSALGKQQQIRENKSQERRFLRVDADKLDQLINLVGELVIAGASANLLARRAGEKDLMEATSLMSRLVEEIRDSSLQLRMVPIGDTFNRFHRVVRDVSTELGKDIEFLINGGEAELDKSVVEKIGDPLMHLVRNAMDHGIESKATRQANGKPDKGTLQLNAYHDSGSIVIEVSDDGGGLNRERILQKAMTSGLVTANQGLSDKEVFNLIFEPGFSTAEQVTNLSGRGVGMDVVKRNIESLRGTVELDSVEGEGTTVKIRLPLTLAIIDGFLVGVGNASYVVPLDAVVECVELSAEEESSTHGRNYVNLRGEVLPFLRLREWFGDTGKASRRENIVVVQYAGHKVGLVVDELLGEFQTVIKPLGKIFSHLQGIGGSTILGSGEVALILDVAALVHLAESAEAGWASRSGKAISGSGAWQGVSLQ